MAWGVFRDRNSRSNVETPCQLANKLKKVKHLLLVPSQMWQFTVFLLLSYHCKFNIFGVLAWWSHKTSYLIRCHLMVWEHLGILSVNNRATQLLISSIASLNPSQLAKKHDTKQRDAWSIHHQNNCEHLHINGFLKKNTHIYSPLSPRISLSTQFPRAQGNLPQLLIFMINTPKLSDVQFSMIQSREKQKMYKFGKLMFTILACKYG